MVETSILSVSQINSYLKAYIDENSRLKNLYVKGEIADFKGAYYSGHLYFTLKDSQSEIRCVMFKTYADRLNFTPQNGMSVIIHCDLTVYQKSGSSQLCIYSMEPEGLGAKYLAFKQLKEKLQQEGLFMEEHKKPLPRFPSTIGVVTSAQGAAIHDIENVVKRRWPLARIILSPSAVQGETAPAELKAALLRLENEIKPDVIIIGRGGGSSDDLDAFNDEELARTIYRCNTPIVSAVGHEIDYSISDFVADLRAPTPSAAAELIVPDMAEISQSLDSNYDWLCETVRKKIGNAETVLKNVGETKFRLLAGKKLDTYGSMVSEKKLKLSTGFSILLKHKEGLLEGALSKLDSNNPAKYLKKTVCIVEKDNRPVKSLSGISPGDKVSLRFSDGTATATIDSVVKGGNGCE